MSKQYTHEKLIVISPKSFNQDLSGWNVSNVTIPYGIFDNCPIKDAYKPKFK